MNKEFQFIETKVEDSIGFIALNRPKVLNAINRGMVSEIVEAMESYDRDEYIRVIVLSGKGRAFAAGADIDEMVDADPIGMELLNQFTDWDRLGAIKKPIIGAIHGFALGGGFELALCCDLLIAAEDAEFGFPEVNLGVMPGAGGTQRLTKLVGRSRALRWLMTGDRFSAKEALHYGVVCETIPTDLLMEETVRFAKNLATKPPLSLRLIKESVQKAVDSSTLEGMQFERKNFYLLFSSEDQKEGMTAFKEKRKPQFRGR
ncbi:enoyl-CoA hydratase/isomerase family protein [Peribacillus acanthi]|uniref:enoyl-CoA hydratase/isomerase family protein n=1 Tax=Peribacillus acanthi TaxID=2171554 RepID=UPI000D3EA3E2|nr:enoyl-CoA hydratase-related protein [Peribacillus acanthi]